MKTRIYTEKSKKKNCGWVAYVPWSYIQGWAETEKEAIDLLTRKLQLR